MGREMLPIVLRVANNLLQSYQALTSWPRE
jgi:hypothetical protein